MAAATTSLEVLIIGKDLFSAAARGVMSGVTALESGAGRMSTAMGKFEGALGHAKSQIGGLLSGPLGVLGLGAGILGVSELMGSALQKTSDFGLEIEKLTHLTGESAQSMGDLALVAEKFGIDFDHLAQVVGFTEKTLGKLQNTAAGAAGGMTVAKAQEELTKANEKLQVSTLKLHEAQGKSSTSASSLAAAQFKVRDAERAVIKAEDDLTAARSNKTTVALNKLQELQQKFGVVLTDSQGKALSFTTVLNHVADYYTSNASAANKATLAAQIFGRGYASLIPVLALGSAGIQRSKQAIDDMGLSMGTDTQGALEAYKQALRSLGEAVDILQIQIGLALEPVLTDLANTVSLFLEHGGAKQIVGFFKSMAEQAKAAGSFIGGTVIPALQAIGGAAVTAWNAIPGPMKTLLGGLFLANKTTKFLFDFGLKDVASAFGGLFSKTFGGGVKQALIDAGIGKAFVQPVFVTNPGFGNLAGTAGEAGGAAAAAGGAAEGLGASAGVAGLSALAAPVAIAAVAIALSAGIPVLLAKLFGATPAPAQYGNLGPRSGSKDTIAAQIAAARSGTSSAIGADRGGMSAAGAGSGTASAIGADRGGLQSIGAASWQTAKNTASIAGTDKAQLDAFNRKWGDQKSLITGIEARSAARYGKALDKLDIMATLNRDLTKEAAKITRGTQDTATKIKELQTLQKEGDPKTRATISGDIRALQKELARKQFSVSVRNQIRIAVTNKISAKEVQSAVTGVATYDKTGIYGAGQPGQNK